MRWLCASTHCSLRHLACRCNDVGHRRCYPLLITNSERRTFQQKRGDRVSYQFGVESNVFRLEEATIDELHDAIKAGRTTCVEVVQCYIDRVRAYNGVG